MIPKKAIGMAIKINMTDEKSCLKNIDDLNFLSKKSARICIFSNFQLMDFIFIFISSISQG
jgi:hypothetical protein